MLSSLRCATDSSFTGEDSHGTTTGRTVQNGAHQARFIPCDHKRNTWIRHQISVVNNIIDIITQKIHGPASVERVQGGVPPYGAIETNGKW